MSTDMDGRMPLSIPTEFPPDPLRVPPDPLRVPPDPLRVRFGQLPNQTMPLEWAEQFLMIVYAEHSGVFRAILPRLYGLPADAPKRSRRQP